MWLLPIQQHSSLQVHYVLWLVSWCGSYPRGCQHLYFFHTSYFYCMDHYAGKWHAMNWSALHWVDQWGKTAGRGQLDTHPTRIGLINSAQHSWGHIIVYLSIPHKCRNHVKLSGGEWKVEFCQKCIVTTRQSAQLSFSYPLIYIYTFIWSKIPFLKGFNRFLWERIDHGLNCNLYFENFIIQAADRQNHRMKKTIDSNYLMLFTLSPINVYWSRYNPFLFLSNDNKKI